MKMQGYPAGNFEGGNAMGLDIYAGTLTRYYSHNWKTVVQQWAEENGYAFNRITPDGEADFLL